MLAKTFFLTFCGLNWTFSLNEGSFYCRLNLNEAKCSAELDCDTGKVSYDASTRENQELDCSDMSKRPFLPAKATKLFIFDEFAGSIQCSRE